MKTMKKTMKSKLVYISGPFFGAKLLYKSVSSNDSGVTIFLIWLKLNYVALHRKFYQIKNIFAYFLYIIFLFTVFTSKIVFFY